MTAATAELSQTAERFKNHTARAFNQQQPTLAAQLERVHMRNPQCPSIPPPHPTPASHLSSDSCGSG
eukprot:2552-Chlamydomonas_euryale.AAC.1